MASSILISGPAAEPVTAEKAMQQLRIDDEANAPLVEDALLSARQDAEFELGRSLITQTRKITLSDWPSSLRFGSALLMDRPPIQSITEVTYWDGGAWEVLPPEQYTLERLDKLHHLLMPVGSWPTLGARPGSRVQITYVAGFGSDGDSVPHVIRTWIVAMAGNRFIDPLGERPPSDHINRQLDEWRTRI